MNDKPASPVQGSGTGAPVAHATTTGMTGGGFYNANSEPQWRATEAVLDLVDQAVADLPLEGNAPIALADFGCSEGRNSIAVMARALARLLPRSNKPVQTIHSDLPTNDFSNLFRSLRPGGRSVFDNDRVFSSIVGGSMYDQLLPPESLHFATTFNAIGFLSERPLDALPGYVFPNGPSAVRNNGHVSEKDKTVFANLANADVNRFLLARAAELVPGGKLLVQVFGANAEARTCDGIYDLLNDAVLSAVEDGDISRKTYEAYYQPVYMRTLNELTAPLTGKGNSAAKLFGIDTTRSYEVAVPFVEAYRKDGDLEAYAKSYVDFFRAFTEAVLRTALPPRPDRQDLIERIFKQARDLLKAAPEAYPFRYVAIAMLLTRKG